MILIFLMLGSMIYAIYRSTDQTTRVVTNTGEVVYGEPMHGLMLGLCIFSGICLLGAVYLADRDAADPRVYASREERESLSKRTL